MVRLYQAFLQPMITPPQPPVPGTPALTEKPITIGDGPVRALRIFQSNKEGLFLGRACPSSSQAEARQVWGVQVGAARRPHLASRAATPGKHLIASSSKSAVCVGIGMRDGGGRPDHITGDTFKLLGKVSFRIQRRSYEKSFHAAGMLSLHGWEFALPFKPTSATTLPSPVQAAVEACLLLAMIWQVLCSMQKCDRHSSAHHITFWCLVKMPTEDRLSSQSDGVTITLHKCLHVMPQDCGRNCGQRRAGCIQRTPTLIH